MTGTLTAPKATSTHPRLMRAAIVRGPGQMTLAQVPVPAVGPGQLRVRLEGCGVCASNLPPWEGRPWFTYPLLPGQLGHEGWGVVEAVGPEVGDFALGDRVAVLSQHAYAEVDVADATATVKLPASMADMAFPAEPLGCAANIFARSQVRAGDTVAIVGIGFLGALLTQMCVRAGARVIAISRRPFSLDFARRFGASHARRMDDHAGIIGEIKELTGGRFCDVVIEAVGKEWPVNLAAELTKERGRLVIAGYHQDGLRSVNMQLWNWRGLDVINAHERDPAVYLAGMQQAVSLVAEGKLDPRPLFTHTFRLDQLAEALTMTRDRPDGFMKALVMM